MSANVDLVRSIYAAWDRGELAYETWAHPEIEYLAGDGLESEVSTGVEAMDERWQRFRETWGDFRAVAEDFRELDGERVLVLIRRFGRGKASGLELDRLRAESAHLFQIRDGKVVRFVHYWDRGRALSDLGLEA